MLSNNQLPRHRNGRFISRLCPKCGYGTLQPEGCDWICDGLLDPEHPNLPLIACDYSVVDGVIYG